MLRCRRLLEHLGNPDQHLSFVHVTGTSGKGSVVTQLHAILHRAGLRVGSYLSPHVTCPLERIALGDGLIPAALFCDLLERMKPTLEAEYLDGPYGLPTFHEVMFALALGAFVEAGVEMVVLEVGIGGTLDSTNVIPPPRVAVVTDVGLDHTELLGPDVATIARDKAGILKRGCVAVTGARKPEALAEIEARAGLEGVALWRVDQEIQFEAGGERFGVRWPDGSLEGLRVGMPGAHQQRNAAVSVGVVAALRAGGFSIPDVAVRAGLLEAFLPGRFEEVSFPGRFEEVSFPGRVDGVSPPNGGRVVLDIAHNPDKIDGMVDTWLERFGPGGAAVVAVSADKDVDGILAALKRAFSRVVVTRPLAVPRRMVSPRELWLKAQAAGLEAYVRLDPEQALELALTLGGGRVVVTGSAYLVGELRQCFQSEQEIVSSGRVRRLKGA